MIISNVVGGLLIGFVVCIVLTIGEQLSDLKQKMDYELQTPELIMKYDYPVETHTVTTEDGYILTMHRIPYSPKSNSTRSSRPIAFLHHTLLCSSACWVIMGPEQALAYLLADAGYDVWLGNARGNKYSRRHKTLKPQQSKYWAFSWHEMGLYDLPATVDYILKITNQKDLYYIGHSMGSTMFYVFMSMRPEYNSKIRLLVSIAPVVYTSHIKYSLFRLAALYEIGEAADRKYNHPILTSSLKRNKLVQRSCRDGSRTQELCSILIYLYAGFDFNQLNRTILPVVFSHFPAGSSLKAWVHYGQGMVSGKFSQYDHGDRSNKRYYGRSYPPEYNLSKVTVPVSIHYGENDILTPQEDIDTLSKVLPNVVNMEVIPVALFNHLDFLWGIDVKSAVYDEVLQVLRKF